MKALLVWTERPLGRAAYRKFYGALQKGYTFEAEDWLQVPGPEEYNWLGTLQMACDVLEYEVLLACDEAAHTHLHSHKARLNIPVHKLY